MAATATPYNRATYHLLKGELDLDGALKAALVTSLYTPDFDAHEFYSQITNEVTGANYTPGGYLLADKTIEFDAVNDRAVVKATNTDALALPQPARAAVLYVDTGNPATAPLIGFIDFGTDLSDLTLQWHVDGFIRLNATQPA